VDVSVQEVEEAWIYEEMQRRKHRAVLVKSPGRILWTFNYRFVARLNVVRSSSFMFSPLSLAWYRS
jgi:hypothetical protein